MAEILLVAADWQLRTLLRAQLLEEGYQVRAWPALEPALVHLLRGGEQPSLVILDAHDLDVGSQMVWDLWRLAGEAHLILCGGLLSQAAWRKQDLPPAHVLLRPFSVGDLVERVRRLLP